MEELLARMELLEQRLAELEARATLPAPLTVVGETGQPLMEVAEVHGTPCLRLFNKDGQSVAVLFADTDGGNLDLYSQDGSMSAGVSAHADGGRIRVYSPEGKMVGAVMATPTGGAIGLTSRSEGGRLVLSAGSFSSVVSLQQGDGAAGALLFLDPTTAGLKVYDPDGKVVFAAPPDLTDTSSGETR